MHFHDYITISQNKQDNSKLCTMLDYHLTCSDHDFKSKNWASDEDQKVGG